jgi:CobQ-like glutamine amidotransferase family enzyme
MTPAPTITVAHLYPAEMNIYGDRGNVMVLRQRLLWRGLGCDVVEVRPGDAFDLRRADIVFGGGGQDAGQVVVADDLAARRDDLHEAVEAGVVMLAICGTYQLLGHRFVTADGADLAGISLFDLETRAGPPGDRLIGNVVIESSFGDIGRVVGFENHGGRTVLGPDQAPFGHVLSGGGNNGTSCDEGAVRYNAVGTYLHGPLLPKNPALADELLRRALARRGFDHLTPLDDTLEQRAAEVASRRPR